MKTVFKEIIIIANLFILSFMLSCNAQSLDTQLNNALSVSSLENVNYSDVQYNRSKITYPINIENKFSVFLNALILDDANINSLCEGGKYQVKYEVKALSPKFISIQKVKASIFCNSYDYAEYSTINLILGNDDKVYKIELKESSESEISDITNNYQFEDVDCNNLNDDVKGYLLFIDKKQKLLIVKNQICIGLTSLNISDVLVFASI